MTSQEEYYYEIANKILRFIKTTPLYLNDLGFNYTVNRWKLEYVQSSFTLTDEMLKDILAILKEDKYIEYDINTIDITEPGRVFIIKGGYTLPEPIEMVESESGLLVPKYSEQKSAQAFKGTMLPPLKKKLLKFITSNKYTNAPEKLIGFLNGENDGSDININQDSVMEISLILERLSRLDHLKLTHGKGYQKFFEENISPFSEQNEKEQIKAQLRSAKSKKWTSSERKKSMDSFLNSLELAYALYILSCFR